MLRFLGLSGIVLGSVLVSQDISNWETSGTLGSIESKIYERLSRRGRTITQALEDHEVRQCHCSRLTGLTPRLESY